MSARNQLLEAPPHAVERALRLLGANLRTARLRRNLTINDVARKIGTGSRAVRDAERGKGSTGVAAYAALLWLYDLLPSLADVANPANDEQGLRLGAARERTRARQGKGLDREF